MPTIHILDWPNPINAGRQSILDAALDAGMPFPHGCRSGECGGCKCRVVSGEVRSLACSPDALSHEEAAQGLILACRTRAIGDVQLRLLQSTTTMPLRTVATTVTSVARASHDVVLLQVTLPTIADFDFLPGQYAQLRFEDLPPRNYSMANQPGDQTLTFHVRVVPDGQVSTHVAEDLQVGDTVTVQGPFGDAVWSEPSDERLLLLAGGTGLAPMLSVLDAALRDGQAPGSIHLFHGVRTTADLYALDALTQRAKAQGFSFTPVCAQSNDDGTPGQHLHEALGAMVGDLSDARVYTAGPPPMVDAVKALALARGTPAERVHADAFFAAAPSRPSLWQRLTGAMPWTS